MPDDDEQPAAYHRQEAPSHLTWPAPPEVVMCNFELSPEAFRQRRLEMIALADERRLARALRRSRARRMPVRRKERALAGRPVGLVSRPVVAFTDG